eukprot:TRINITY_DN2301_c0_g1_i1.p1 TRINITY_DN2301_c0_g1~~TRINITY_DN2301_c0_g1_i1.p1  ORF type:complete len:631 (+),score=183.62 TRINITY_DN2301_c0_g1_i1:71-1894(+)
MPSSGSVTPKRELSFGARHGLRVTASRYGKRMKLNLARAGTDKQNQQLREVAEQRRVQTERLDWLETRFRFYGLREEVEDGGSDCSTDESGGSPALPSGALPPLPPLPPSRPRRPTPPAGLRSNPRRWGTLRPQLHAVRKHVLDSERMWRESGREEEEEPLSPSAAALGLQSPVRRPRRPVAVGVLLPAHVPADVRVAMLSSGSRQEEGDASVGDVLRSTERVLLLGLRAHASRNAAREGDRARHTLAQRRDAERELVKAARAMREETARWRQVRDVEVEEEAGRVSAARNESSARFAVALSKMPRAEAVRRNVLMAVRDEELIFMQEVLRRGSRGLSTPDAHLEELVRRVISCGVTDEPLARKVVQETVAGLEARGMALSPVPVSPPPPNRVQPYTPKPPTPPSSGSTTPAPPCCDGPVAVAAAVAALAAEPGAEEAGRVRLEAAEEAAVGAAVLVVGAAGGMTALEALSALLLAAPPTRLIWLALALGDLDRIRSVASHDPGSRPHQPLAPLDSDSASSGLDSSGSLSSLDGEVEKFTIHGKLPAAEARSLLDHEFNSRWRLEIEERMIRSNTISLYRSHGCDTPRVQSRRVQGSSVASSGRSWT